MNLRPCGLLIGVALLGAAHGCGGGGGGAGGTSEGTLDFQVLWEQPAENRIAASHAAGEAARVFGRDLPPAVRTIRVIFESQAGFRCCVGVDPRAPDFGRERLLVLTRLPSGPATVTLAGFATAIVPADRRTPPCLTRPVPVGRPCAERFVATPSFVSEPHTVAIEPGARADAGEIAVFALPFLLERSLEPDPGSATLNPVRFRFTVVDAVTGVDPESVALAVTQDERVPVDVTLVPCDDRGTLPCSVGGALEVSGFAAVSGPQLLDDGAAEMAITAANLADPPRALDVSYPFDVGLERTRTPDRTFGIPTRTPRRTATRRPLAPTPTPTPTPTVAGEAR